MIPLSETITITQMHVPVDDTHTYWYSFFTSFAGPLDKEAMRAQRLACVTLPDYAPIHGRHDHWGFDPEDQRTRTYLGMGEDDINLHDQWAVESMGEIQDRTREHLGTSDKVIMANRRTLAEGDRDGARRRPAADGARRRGSGSADRARHDRLHRARPIAGKPTGPRRRAPSAAAAGVARAGGQRAGDAVRPLRPRPAGDPARRRREPPTTRRARLPAKASRCAIEAEAIETVRVGWCDLHGVLRGKTLVASALAGAFESGVGMVSTILLKDTSDRTAYRVFEPGARRDAARLRLRQQPASCGSIRRAFASCRGRRATGWLRGEACFDDGSAVPIDTRRVLQAALARLRRRRLRPAAAASRSSSTSTGSPRATPTARSTRRAPPGPASRPR